MAIEAQDDQYSMFMSCYRQLCFQPETPKINISHMRLSGRKLMGLSLMNVNLSNVIFEECTFHDADFSGSVMIGCEFYECKIGHSKFDRSLIHNSTFNRTMISNCSFIKAKMQHVDLHRTQLDMVDFSGATGLLDPIDWMKNFKQDSLGYIVYKSIGLDTPYYSRLPHSWVIKEGEILHEVCDSNRTTSCGCGVNFGTFHWCMANYPHSTLWECRIRYEHAAGIVVPYNTDGKARCSHLELLRIFGT